MSTDATKQVATPDAPRKPYSPPAVAEYGTVAALTASGASGQSESLPRYTPPGQHA